MMTIDYALIRLSLWLTNLQPPDLEWLIDLGFVLATPFAFIVAAAYVVQTIRARGYQAFAERLPSLALSGVGVWALSIPITSSLVLLANVAVFAAAGAAVEAIGWTLPHAWAVWHALGGTR